MTQNQQALQLSIDGYNQTTWGLFITPADFATKRRLTAALEHRQLVGCFSCGRAVLQDQI